MTEWINKGKDVFINNYKQHPIIIEKGKGSIVFDLNGKGYLDFVAGIAVNSLGYNHEMLNRALENQINQFIHCSNLYYNKASIQAAEMLIKASGLEKVFFCNSGAEANEAAIKLCRKYGQMNFGEDKIEIVTMRNSFHGRTIAALTATGQEKYQQGFGPLLAGVLYCEFNNQEDLIKKVSKNTCAIIIEIIQGEGGINSIEPEFIKKIQELCNEYDVLLIVDEVQTGIGRTGEMFAYQLYKDLGFIPDVITVAKGLGAGVAIGAMIIHEKLSKVFQPGDHGCTFGGNPLACTAACVVLNELMNNGLIDEVKAQGNYLQDELIKLKKKMTCIRKVKGIGLIQGIELDGVDIPSVIEKCMEKGLLLVGAGSNVIRFLPPLIIKKEEINQAILILESCLE